MTTNKEKSKRVIIFDLWETLIFGTEDSAISIFYNKIVGENISNEQLRDCMLIKDSEPRKFIEEFLEKVTPSNISSMLLSLKNPRSPLYREIISDFNKAIKQDSQEIRWLPGAIELLGLLKGKYTLVLVSNLWAYQKEYLFKNLQLGRYFDRCLFSCDLGINKPQILQDISKLLQINTSDAIFIGKSYEYDIVPAVNADISAMRLASENNVISPQKTAEMISEELDGLKADFKNPPIINKNKKEGILIAIPPFYKLLGSHNNRLNLSASYLSARLSYKGHANKIYHCDSEPKEDYITRYQMVFNSINFYESMATENSYREFEDYYRDNKSDIVFVTCGDTLNPSFDSGNWDSTKKIAKIIRKINPRAYIIGIGPELGPDSEDFDLLVYNEVESLIDEIISKRIGGRVWGGLLPERELTNFSEFEIKNIITPISPVSLDTVIWRRGCKGGCDFCRVAQINKGLVRYRPIEAVMREIGFRCNKLKLNNFYLVDADFSSDKEMGIKFCKRLQREFPGIKWRTESRFDSLNKELLVEMKKAGCTHIKLGLENALHERHQVKTKKVNLEFANKWVRDIHGLGINCIIYLMLGGKWFTHQQYMEMYRNADALRAGGYTISLFTPYPSTPAGISYEEWKMRKFTGSHLDIRLVDFWKIPIDVLEKFFSLELIKGREDKDIRNFIY